MHFVTLATDSPDIVSAILVVMHVLYFLNCSFCNDNASTIASDIVKGRYDGVWPEWGDVPADVKDMLFNSFLVTVIFSYLF